MEVTKTFVQVGGWVVIKSILQFCLILIMLTSMMRWFQKCCQKVFTAFLKKRYEHFKLKIRQKKTACWKGNWLKNFYWQEMRLSPMESLWSFPKKPVLVKRAICRYLSRNCEATSGAVFGKKSLHAGSNYVIFCKTKELPEPFLNRAN